ncbi:unnamed protein product [Urochloa humidicola]
MGLLNCSRECVCVCVTRGLDASPQPQTPRGSGGRRRSPAPRRCPTESPLTGGHTRPVRAAVPSPSEFEVQLDSFLFCAPECFSLE